MPRAAEKQVHPRAMPAAAAPPSGTKPSLQVPPTEVIYKDLGFSVPVQVPGTKDIEQRTLIEGITGKFAPGRLTAIMGPSGAGKTTLMNYVAGRLQKGTASGSITVNGEVLSSDVMAGMVGFVFQDDVIMETQTVREAVAMSAQLRLPESVPKHEKLARVDELLEMLHLTNAANTCIGSALVKGVSGGERKRTAIANEMITNPSILFLDEPTSGLDAYMAYSIVTSLKKLAEAGRTVVCTIHQPSSDTFHLFDDLVLLGDGRMLYSGPMDGVVDYFAKQGFRCPTYSNPADFLFMSVVNVTGSGEASPLPGSSDYADDGTLLLEEGKSSREMYAVGSDGAKKTITELNKDRMRDLADKWAASTESQAVVDSVRNPAYTGGVAQSALRVQPSLGTQMRLLMERSFKNQMRNKMLLRGKFAQTIVMSLIVGLIYLDLGNNQASIQDRNGFLFFLTINNVMTPAMTVLSVFGNERAVFVREHLAGLYSLPAYFLSKILTELPSYVIMPMFMVVILYWMVGLQNDAGKFFIILITVSIVNNCGGAIGVMAACQWEDIAVALAILPVFLLPLMLFSGLFINSDSIPVYFRWIEKISPMKYGYELLADTEYRGLALECDKDELVLSEAGDLVCPVTTGEQALRNLDFGSIDKATNFAALVGIYVGLLLLAYVGLYRLVQKHKNK